MPYIQVTFYRLSLNPIDDNLCGVYHIKTVFDLFKESRYPQAAQVPLIIKDYIYGHLPPTMGHDTLQIKLLKITNFASSDPIGLKIGQRCGFFLEITHKKRQLSSLSGY